ncbi:MAG: hypothetical protein GX625_20705 [Clostridiaceae bacterium]|jgi:hypothetical protein|nr:hypothetical protein [Clostridiaceae bacterium]
MTKKVLVNKNQNKTRSIPKKKTQKMDKLLVWKTVIWAAPVIGALIGGIISLIANYKVNNIELERKSIEDMKSATSGSISPKNIVEINRSQPISILAGGNKYITNAGSLLSGKVYKPLESIGSDFSLYIKLSSQGTLSINCMFRDFNGKIVAEMNENEWKINPNNYFKRNYDAQGIEVIDQEGITKFQIDFIDFNIIKLGGVFKDSKNLMFVSDTMTTIYDIRSISKEESIKKSETIPEIFLYPAEKYFGQRKTKE